MTELVVQEAATWLEANPPSENKMAGLEKRVDSGWAAPSWPKEWFGRGLSSDEAFMGRQRYSPSV